MVQLSFTHVAKDRPGNNGLLAGQGLNFDPSNRGNDNVNVPQAISLFYGGRIYGEHLGALIQGTYDGVGNRFFLDLTDVRLTAKPDLFGKPLVLGLTVNNNPTVSDVLNTTPAWGFPAGGPGGGHLHDPRSGASDRRSGQSGGRDRGLFFLEQPALRGDGRLPHGPEGGDAISGRRHCRLTR